MAATFGVTPEIWRLMECSLGIPQDKIENHPVTLSLIQNGILSFYADFTVLSDKDIADLHYEDPTHGMVKLSIAQRRMISVALAAWHDLSRSIATPADLKDLTKPIVDEYRIKKFVPNDPIIPWHKTVPVSDTAKGWKQNIKPTPNDYPVFQNDLNFKLWEESVETTLVFHGLGHLTDPKYKPVDEEEHKQKKFWFYKVLQDKCKAPVAQSIVRKYLKEKDIPAIWKDLHEHYESAITTNVYANKISTFLTSVKLATCGWTGTNTEFVLNWKTKAELHNRISKSPFTEDQLQNLLENALIGSPLQQVRNNLMISQKSAGGGANLTFPEYVALLVEHSNMEDIGNMSSKNSRGKMSVNSHIIFDDDVGNDESQYIDIHRTSHKRSTGRHNIDTGVDELLAFQTNLQGGSNKTRRVYVNADTWKALSEEERDAWDKLSDESKNKILEYGAKRESYRHQKPTNSRPNRRVNVHDSVILDEDPQDANKEIQVSTHVMGPAKKDNKKPTRSPVLKDYGAEKNVTFDESKEDKEDTMLVELTSDKTPPKDASTDDAPSILDMITQKTPSVKNTPWENDEFNINVMLSNRKKEENRKMSIGMHDLVIEDGKDEAYDDGDVARTQYTVNMHRFSGKSSDDVSQDASSSRQPEEHDSTKGSQYVTPSYLKYLAQRGDTHIQLTEKDDESTNQKGVSGSTTTVSSNTEGHQDDLDTGYMTESYMKYLSRLQKNTPGVGTNRDMANDVPAPEHKEDAVAHAPLPEREVNTEDYSEDYVMSADPSVLTNYQLYIKDKYILWRNQARQANASSTASSELSLSNTPTPKKAETNDTPSRRGRDTTPVSKLQSKSDPSTKVSRSRSMSSLTRSQARREGHKVDPVFGPDWEAQQSNAATVAAGSSPSTYAAIVSSPPSPTRKEGVVLAALKRKDPQIASLVHKVKAASPQNRQKAINASLRKQKQQRPTGPSYENPRHYRPSGNDATHMVSEGAPNLLRPTGDTISTLSDVLSSHNVVPMMPDHRSQGIVTESYRKYRQKLVSANTNVAKDDLDSVEEQFKTLSSEALGDSSRLGLSRRHTPRAVPQDDSAEWSTQKKRGRRGKSTSSPESQTTPCKFVTDAICGVKESKTSDSDETYVVSSQNSKDQDNRYAALEVFEDEDDDLIDSSARNESGSEDNQAAQDEQDFQLPGSS